VASVDAALLAAVEHDFSYFAAAIAGPDLRIEVRPDRPDCDSLPELTSSVATPRNISFMGDGVVSMACAMWFVKQPLSSAVTLGMSSKDRGPAEGAFS